MTWDNFKQYLEEEILQKKEEAEEENEEDEEESEEEQTYTLRSKAKDKYQTKKEQELLATLANLIDNIDNNSEFSGYYELPLIEDLLTEKGQIKQWTDFFPKREETHFGKKQDTEEGISIEVWKVLEKIFNDYAQTITRVDRLKALVDEKGILGKFLVEVGIHLNYEMIRERGYDRKLRDWLKEYEQLEEGEKENLTEQKKFVETASRAFEEETKNRQKSEENKNWYSNIPWKKVALYGGGGLVIVLVLGWLWGKMKK